MSIGELIKKYCKEHSVSYQQYATTCNVSKAYISMLINGKNPKTGKPLRPTIETYQSLAEGMGMTLDELFDVMDDAPVRLTRSKPIDSLHSDSSDDDAIWARREALRRDPKRKLLFDLAENGTQKDIDAAVALIDALRATNPDFYDGDDPA